MGLARWSSLLLALSVSLARPAAAAPPAGYEGVKYLPVAPYYVAARPESCYDLLDEGRKLLGTKLKAAMVMLTAQMSRWFGFDPTTRSWIASAGLDPAAPILASLSSLDSTKVRARQKKVEAAARAYIAKRGESSTYGGGLDLRAVDGPPALISHRLVLKLKDESKGRQFMVGLQGILGAQRLHLMQTKAESGPALASMLGMDAVEAGALAEKLIARGVATVARPEADVLALFRVVDGYVILDAVNDWFAMPSKPGAAFSKELLAVLTLPKRPGLELEKPGVGKRAFAEDAALALFFAAKPLLTMGELQDERRTLRSAGWARDGKALDADLKKVRACAASFGAKQISAGDLALQLRANRQGAHAKAFWAAPAALVRGLTAAASKQDLIDPTEWQTKVVALAGTTLDLGSLSKTVGRGAYKLAMKGFDEKASACSELTPLSILVGGWPALLGVARAEAKTGELAGAIVDSLQNGMVVMRELSSLSTPSFLFHLRIGSKGAVKVKEEATKLTNSYSRPENHTSGGRSSTIYRYLKAPLSGYGLSVTDLKKEGIGLTISNRPWDLTWFLEQTPPSARVLPKTMLAFGHVDLSTVFARLATDKQGVQGPLRTVLKAASSKVERLGGNISVSEGLITADLDLGLKL